MISENELYEKYNTGHIYVSPAAIDYFDSKFRTSYYCEAEFKDLLKDYTDHMLLPPTQRCFYLPKAGADGVIRDGGFSINDEEIKWLWVEYTLRCALNKFTSSNKVKFIVTVIHD